MQVPQLPTRQDDSNFEPGLVQDIQQEFLAGDLQYLLCALDFDFERVARPGCRGGAAEFFEVGPGAGVAEGLGQLAALG